MMMHKTQKTFQRYQKKQKEKKKKKNHNARDGDKSNPIGLLIVFQFSKQRAEQKKSTANHRFC
jgi:hypothetical protein